jgi:hypothetical protein
LKILKEKQLTNAVISSHTHWIMNQMQKLRSNRIPSPER